MILNLLSLIKNVNFNKTNSFFLIIILIFEIISKNNLFKLNLTTPTQKSNSHKHTPLQTYLTNLTLTNQKLT